MTSAYCQKLNGVFIVKRLIITYVPENQLDSQNNNVFTSSTENAEDSSK